MNERELELRDLKTAWNELDARLDTRWQRMEAVVRDLGADKTRSLARRATMVPLVELTFELVGIAFVIYGFAFDGTAVYLGSLVGSLAVLIALAVSAIAQITMLAGLDPTSPVVATQRRLGRVRAWRIFEWKWVLLTAPTSWIVLLVVAVELPLKIAFDGGADTGVFSAGYVAVNLAVGAVLSFALWRGAGWLRDRCAGSGFVQRFLDDLAGRRLTAMRDFLARLDDFEQD